MWTLVFITALVESPTNGVHSTVTTFKFDTQEQCDVAAKQLNIPKPYLTQRSAAIIVSTECIVGREVGHSTFQLGMLTP